MTEKEAAKMAREVYWFVHNKLVSQGVAEGQAHLVGFLTQYEFFKQAKERTQTK